MATLSLVDAAALDAARLDVVREIYLDAFPASLRVPFDDLLVDHLLVLLDGPSPVGLALVRDLGETTWTFLRYYAVGPRGGGVGSAMWRALTERLRAAGRTRLIWDVEDPDEPGLEADEAEVHRRRIGFYERCGARLLPVHGYAPPHDGEIGAPPLLLMDQVLDAAAETYPHLEAELRDVVTGVYRWRYAIHASDPIVDATLRASGLLMP